MFAVDTNILVHAHREEAEYHKICKKKLKEFAEGLDLWGIPVFCIGEFIRIVTHNKVFDPPSSPPLALDNIDSLLKSPSLEILMPSEEFWSFLKREIAETKCRGNLIFDAQIVALCKEHGIKEILTLDNDFKRFSQITVVSPINL